MSKAKCRAKVILQKISSIEQENHFSADYEFMYVYSDKEGSENKKFWDATPCGEFTMRSVNNKLDLKVGQEYYIDLIEAPKEEE